MYEVLEELPVVDSKERRPNCVLIKERTWFVSAGTNTRTLPREFTDGRREGDVASVFVPLQVYRCAVKIDVGLYGGLAEEELGLGPVLVREAWRNGGGGALLCSEGT